MSFGAYLIGTFERRLGIFTQFQIVNATPKQIVLHLVYLDAGGHVLFCEMAELNGNGLWERDTAGLGDHLKSDLGVFKAFALRDGKLVETIAGLQRRALAGPAGKIGYAALAESNLAAVPMKVAESDYEAVKAHCP